MNAYSADFVHGLEALSQSLSQVLAKLDGNEPSNWEEMASGAIMSPGPGHNSRQSPWPATRPPLPDPRLVRRIIRQRQLRSRFFADELFADPVWDMLLDDSTDKRRAFITLSDTAISQIARYFETIGPNASSAV